MADKTSDFLKRKGFRGYDPTIKPEPNVVEEYPIIDMDAEEEKAKLPLIDKCKTILMDGFYRQLLTQFCLEHLDFLDVLEELDDAAISHMMTICAGAAGLTQKTLNNPRVWERFTGYMYFVGDRLTYGNAALKSILPKNSLITNSNVANALRNLQRDIQNMIPVVKKGKVVAETKITINILDSESSRFSFSNDSITEYDKMVHDAICTLYAAGNKIMTADMVYRAMNGFVETEKVSPRAVQLIDKSILKMSSTRIYIDSTDQLRASGLLNTGQSKAIMSEHMINIREMRAVTGGRTKSAYRILSAPIIYAYSAAENQILSVPRELLNTKNITRASDMIMLIRYHLLRRIETMKQTPEEGDALITYDSLYRLSEEPVEDRRVKATIRSDTEKLLNNYVQIGYIAGFRQIRRGATIIGVEISLP